MSEVSAKNVVLEELKAEGLDLAEETVAGVVRAVFKAVPRMLPASVAAIVGPMLMAVQPAVMALVDKIDGEDDPGR